MDSMRKSRNTVDQALNKMAASDVTTAKMAASGNHYTRSKRKAVLTDYDMDNRGGEWTTAPTADTWSHKGSDRNRKGNKP
jgi:hypothetical protein